MFFRLNFLFHLKHFDVLVKFDRGNLILDLVICHGIQIPVHYGLVMWHVVTTSSIAIGLSHVLEKLLQIEARDNYERRIAASLIVPAALAQANAVQYIRLDLLLAM